MSSLTPLAHFQHKTFHDVQEADCMICLDRVDKGVFHYASNSEREKTITHLAHQSCLASWIQECSSKRKLASCPKCNILISERSLQQIFRCFSENNLAKRSYYWQQLFVNLLEKAPFHQENKEHWKIQAEIVIDEMRFILDGIHRFYITSNQQNWIEEPLEILTVIKSMFDLPKLALVIKKRGLPLPDHLHHLTQLTPSMEKHVLKVVDFLSECVEIKKRMIEADDLDQRLVAGSTLYFCVAGVVCGALASLEIADYFTQPDKDAYLLMLKLLGAFGFLGGIYKAAHLSQEHLAASFRRLSMETPPAALGEYVNT